MYKVTDKRKFRKVSFVDTSMLRTSTCPRTGNVTGEGTLTISANDGDRHITGQHGQNDYAEEFGFILTA
jgi:hypothetical protein